MLRSARRLRISSTARAATWTGRHRSGHPVRLEAGSGRACLESARIGRPVERSRHGPQAASGGTRRCGSIVRESPSFHLSLLPNTSCRHSCMLHSGDGVCGGWRRLGGTMGRRSWRSQPTNHTCWQDSWLGNGTAGEVEPDRERGLPCHGHEGWDNAQGKLSIVYPSSRIHCPVSQPFWYIPFGDVTRPWLHSRVSG